MNHKKTSINQPKNWKSSSNRSQGNVSIYLSPSFPSVVSPKHSWNSLRWSLLGLWKHRKNRYLGVWRVQRPSPQPNSNPSRPPKCPKVLAANLLKDGGLAIYLKLGRRKVRNWWNWLKIAVNVCGWGTVWCCFSLFVGSFCFSGLRFRGGLWSFRYLFLKFASPKEESRDRPWCLWKRQGKKFGFSD